MLKSSSTAQNPVQSRNSTTNRLSGLDSLRGLAILLVMIGHFLPQAFPDLNVQPISSFGGAGVLLFFYLSGLLIFRNLQSNSASVFLVRRFFKLMPAYWVNLIVIVALGAMLHVGEPPHDAATVLINILLLQDLAKADSLNGVYWTLLIEAKFYLVMVAFCSVCGTKRIYWLLAALVGIDVVAFVFMHRGSMLFTYLITFFPGIAVAHSQETQGKYGRRLLVYLVIVGITALSLFVFLSGNGGSQAIYALIFAPLLWAAVHRPLPNRFAQFFGKISYSHYLFHTVIGYPIIDYIASDGSVANRIGALVVASLFTVAISTVSYHFVEKPAVNFGHSITRRLAHKRRPVSS